VLDSAPTNGSFRGKLRLKGGWHDLSVIAYAGSTAMATSMVQRVGVGEVFVPAGQSNAANYGQPRLNAMDDRVSALQRLKSRLVVAINAYYPKRFAIQALAGNSKAVHHAYSRHAEVTVPSLDDWEKEWNSKTTDHRPLTTAPKLVPVDFRAGAAEAVGTDGEVTAAATRVG
jgi:hypothetical protein